MDKTRMIEKLIERGDRRALAALEMMRPLPFHVRLRNAAHHWGRP